MMRYSAWVAAVSTCVLIWHECAENPAFFCYRIGLGAFTTVRSRALTLAPVMQFTARNDPRCSTRSGICSTPSTMSKD
jgi:hypothetical protein